MVAKVKRCTISRHLFVYVSEEETNIEKIKNHFIFILWALLLIFFLLLFIVRNTFCDMSKLHCIYLLWMYIYKWTVSFLSRSNTRLNFHITFYFLFWCVTTQVAAGKKLKREGNREGYAVINSVSDQRKKRGQ